MIIPSVSSAYPQHIAPYNYGCAGSIDFIEDLEVFHSAVLSQKLVIIFVLQQEILTVNSYKIVIPATGAC